MGKPDCLHETGTHCIHSSERRSFRGCRRRWHFAYREHYVPQITPKPLEFGIAFHEGMEAFYDPEFWETRDVEEKLNCAIQAFTERCNNQRERFLKETRQTKLTHAQGDDYAERIDLGVGMLSYYARDVHPEADKFYRPVAVEVPFSIPLNHPHIEEELTCSNSPNCGQSHANPAPVTLNGRVDAIFEDIVNGGYYIIDWKSAAQLINDGEFLQLDDQITSYCAALEYVLELDIRGFLYAEIRKDYPKPPAENTRRYRGRLFSTNATQMTTLDLARKTFKERDAAAYQSGLYDEYLERLTREPPKFHQRFPVIQSEAKYRNVLKNVAKEALEMTSPVLDVYPAPSKNSCQGCAFKAPCLAVDNDEDYIYTLESLFGQKRFEE